MGVVGGVWPNIMAWDELLPWPFSTMRFPRAAFQLLQVFLFLYVFLYPNFIYLMKVISFVIIPNVMGVTWVWLAESGRI